LSFVAVDRGVLCDKGGAYFRVGIAVYVPISMA